MCGVGGCHYQGQVAHFLFLFIKRKHIQVCMVHIFSLRDTFLMQHVIPLYSHHSYEFMRKNLIFYRTEIHRLTGKVRLILVELVRLKQLVGRYRGWIGIILVLIFLHRIHWNSTEYQMKHASRSAMACRLHPEIPHPCKSASSVRTLVLAQSAIYFPLDIKLPLPQTHIFLSLFRSVVQAENVPRPCYLCHSQLGNCI